jgi:hypothetical protein
VSETTVSDQPRLTIEMLRANEQAVLREPPRGARASFHHPRCHAIETRRLEDCNCGGAALPAAVLA